MKKITLSLLLLIFLSLFLLNACTQPGGESDKQSEETMLDAEPVQDSDEISGETEMEALIVEKIKDNHKLAFILSKNKTREEWSKTIDRMIGYGAKISPDEKERIIEWLVSRNE